MTNTTALLATLDSELVDALAASPAKLRKRRHEPEGSLLAEARERVEVAKTDAKRAVSEAEDAEYKRTAGRLAELGKLVSAARIERGKFFRVEGSGKDAKQVLKRLNEAQTVKLGTIEQDLANYKLEQSVLFGQPINPTFDLASNGRFIRSLRYHDRQVGMLNQGYDDMLSEALELCYRDQSMALVEVTRFTASGNVVMFLPTVGALYRACKRAYGLERNRFRKARQGLTRMYSLDQLAEIGVEASESFDWYGYDYGDSAGLLEAMIANDVAEDYESRTTAAERLLAEREAAQAVMRDRMASAGLSADVDRPTRVAVKMLAAGDTIANVARKLGISQPTLIANVKAADWRPTMNSAVDSAPVGNMEPVPERPQANGISRERSGAVQVTRLRRLARA